MQIKSIGIVGLLFLAVLIGCHQNQQKMETNFERVAVGDTIDHVIEIMGKPTSQSSFEAPLVELKQCIWKSSNGDLYTINLIRGKVISKSTTH